LPSIVDEHGVRPYKYWSRFLPHFSREIDITSFSFGLCDYRRLSQFRCQSCLLPTTTSTAGSTTSTTTSAPAAKASTAAGPAAFTSHTRTFPIAYTAKGAFTTSSFSVSEGLVAASSLTKVSPFAGLLANAAGLRSPLLEALPAETTL